jgi:hypothetical protein
MAINIPIITSLEDTGIKNAKAAFGDFKTAVGQAEGGLGKFKAGSKVALDAVAAQRRHVCGCSWHRSRQVCS